MKITPLFDRVLLKPIAEQSSSAGAIILPSSLEDRPEMAKVSAIGSGTQFDGKESKMQVKVGDEVMFSRFAGIECKFDGESYILIRQADILAILNK